MTSFMAGDQFGFIYSWNANLEAERMDIVTAKLDHSLDIYEIKSSYVKDVQRSLDKRIKNYCLSLER